MSELSRDDVLAAVHPLDDATIAEIIATGVTPAELSLACAYVMKDKTGVRSPIDNPKVERVVRLIEKHGLSVKSSYFGESGSTLA